MADTSIQSGGINIQSQQTSVGGDMVGRDKIVHEAPAPLATSLHQLPAPPDDFTGRGQELEDIRNHLQQGAIITGIRGLGGIGKTALALKLADLIKDRYPDAQFFVNLRGASDRPLSPAEAMTHVIRAYYPTSKLPDDEAELQALYCTVLHDQRALVLLDDAKDAQQVTPLIPPKTCLLLITSRQHFHLPGLHATDLEQLPLEDARKLLIEIAPRLDGVIPSRNAAKNLLPAIAEILRPFGTQNDSIGCADVIAALCGCLPQALRAAGSLIAATIDLDPLDYVRQLRDERHRLENIGIDPNTNISVEASLNLSYATLPAAAQRVFGQLSVFPAAFEAAAEAQVCDDAAHAHLSRLVQLSLVNFDRQARRYQLHDLVRLFAAARLSEDERYAAQQRHAEHYKNVLSAAQQLYLQGGENITHGLASFDLEWSNIQAGQAWAATNAQRDDDAAQLCDDYPNAGVYTLQLRLHPREQIQWLEDALTAARHLKNRTREGIHLGNLGRAYADLGETRKAIEYHEQALKVMRNIGDRRGEGNALGHLGIAYADLGETRKAIEFYEKALSIVRDIGDKRNEGAWLGNLGLAYAALGETRTAIEFYEQHRAIAREIGDRHGEGAALGNLGLAYYLLGETRQAIEYYEQALIIARDIGDKRNEGIWLGNLGLAYANLGETRQAIEFYEQQLRITREIGDRRGEGAALWNMALALDELGERAQASAHAEAALTICEQIEAPYAEKVRKRLAEWKG